MKLGFGAWQLGGECTFGGRQTGWGKFNQQEAEAAVFQALENGITFFDTAPGYGKGKSESVLGDVFSKQDSSLLQVCTKYGSYENEIGEAYLDFSTMSLFSSVEESLKRLKIPRLDTILLHSPPDDFDYLNFDISPFEKLKAEGLISHYGVSVRSLRGAENVVSLGFGDTIEAIFNVLDRRAEESVFENPNFEKYRFVARVPLASGILTEQFLHNPDLQFAETDIRASISQSDRNWYAAAVKKLSFLNELSGGISVSALRYVLHHPKVDFVIPGTRSVKNLEMNLLAHQLGPLTDEVKNRIKESLSATNPNWIPKSN